MKKVFCFILIACFVLGCVPVFAEDTLSYESENGGAIVETDNDQRRNILTVCFDYQIVVGVLHSGNSLEVTRIYKKSQEYFVKGDTIAFTTEYEGLEKLVGETVTAYVKKSKNGENVLLAAKERPGV